MVHLKIVNVEDQFRHIVKPNLYAHRKQREATKGKKGNNRKKKKKSKNKSAKRV